MRGLDPPCEVCGNSLPVTALARECPGCDRRHWLCILCEIVHSLVEVDGPDSNRLRVCPDALVVASELMGPEGVAAEERRRAKKDGGFLYSSAGKSRWKGSDGTTTRIEKK